jgi:acetylornithine deacetylase
MFTGGHHRKRAPVMTDIATWLEKLVACDTQNPPRHPAGFHALFDLITPHLHGCGFVVSKRDLGDGCMWLRAVRGSPAWFVNVHVDTVPAAPGWQSHAWQLQHDGDDLVGLGAADTKGALACFLGAAAQTDGAAELVLTTDEEAGSSKCVRTYVAEHLMTGRVAVVAEPTMAKAVFAHRGIATCTATFSGVAGHASQARARVDSSNHAAIRFASSALHLADEAGDGPQGLRFNIGVVQGGQKANMIASETTVRFGFRPPSGSDTTAIMQRLQACAEPARVTFVPGYVAPPLPAAGRTSDAAQRFAHAAGMEAGAPVDFFTEAALFSEAGADALVFGAGDIAVAHAPGERVSLTQLAKVESVYRHMMSRVLEVV